MRGNKIANKVAGIIMAVTGAVILIHTVPVSIWVFVLIALILVFAFMILNNNSVRRK